MMINQAVIPAELQKNLDTFAFFQTLLLTSKPRKSLPRSIMNLIGFYAMWTLDDAKQLIAVYKFMNRYQLDMKSLSARTNFINKPVGQGSGVEYDNLAKIQWKRLLNSQILSRTIMMTAIMQSWPEVLGVMLGKGASTELKDMNGYTLLMMSAFRGIDDNVTLLLERKANVTALDNHENSALMWACFNGTCTTQIVLLLYGANAKLADKQQKTALDYACESEDEDTIALLRV
jgi:hypothetical protein